MPPKKFIIHGVHPYKVTEETFRETMASQYGDDLAPEEQAQVEQQICEHFQSLYVLEVSGDELGAEFPWADVTQDDPETGRDSWQVPYDERPLGPDGKRWAFFFHFLRLDRPLRTPYGPMDLPRPTPIPEHLKDMVYEAP